MLLCQLAGTKLQPGHACMQLQMQPEQLLSTFTAQEWPYD